MATGRLPQLGNAEFGFIFAGLIVAAIVVGFADTLNVNSWFDYFKWVSVAYILSRGVAKASRVFEQ
jgi:uncharacterized protein (DUF983 family)